MASRQLPSNVRYALTSFMQLAPILEAAAGNRADDEKGLRPGGDGVGERSIRRFVREVLLARKESDKRAALLCDVIAKRAAQHRIGSLQGIEHRTLRHRAGNLHGDLALNLREGPQMRRKPHPN